jgi:hypothetical protein
VLFYVLFVCKCVLYYCHRVSTEFQFKTYIKYVNIYKYILREGTHNHYIFLCELLCIYSTLLWLCIFYGKPSQCHLHRKSLPHNALFWWRCITALSNYINTLRKRLLNCLNARSRGLTFRHRASSI